MKIVDLLTEDCVAFLDAADKVAVLAELAALAADINPKLNSDKLCLALEHRESLMSTGMGQGIAVPHVRLTEIDKPVMIIGLSRKGISDYGAMDGQPVHILVMIAAQAGQHETYLQLLAQAMEKLREESDRQNLLQCKTPAAVLEFLTI